MVVPIVRLSMNHWRLEDMAIRIQDKTVETKGGSEQDKTAETKEGSEQDKTAEAKERSEQDKTVETKEGKGEGRYLWLALTAKWMHQHMWLPVMDYSCDSLRQYY